jgi:hypothetical protein
MVPKALFCIVITSEKQMLRKSCADRRYYCLRPQLKKYASFSKEISSSMAAAQPAAGSGNEVHLHNFLK